MHILVCCIENEQQTKYQMVIINLWVYVHSHDSHFGAEFMGLITKDQYSMNTEEPIPCGY